MDPHNRDDIPSFQLPDWGTDGAPPAPDDSQEPAPDGPTVTVEVDHSLVVFTGDVPGVWALEAVLGLVCGDGASERSHPAKATASAREEALKALHSAGRELGANAIGGVNLAISSRKSRTVVIAYGTAMQLRRD